MRDLAVNQNPSLWWGLSFAKKGLPRCYSRTQTLGTPALQSKAPSECRISFWTISYAVKFAWSTATAELLHHCINPLWPHLHLQSSWHPMAESHPLPTSSVAKAGACQAQHSAGGAVPALATASKSPLYHEIPKRASEWPTKPLSSFI